MARYLELWDRGVQVIEREVCFGKGVHPFTAAPQPKEVLTDEDGVEIVTIADSGCANQPQVGEKWHCEVSLSPINVVQKRLGRRVLVARLLRKVSSPAHESPKSAAQEPAPVVVPSPERLILREAPSRLSRQEVEETFRWKQEQGAHPAEVSASSCSVDEIVKAVKEATAEVPAPLPLVSDTDVADAASEAAQLVDEYAAQALIAQAYSRGGKGVRTTSPPPPLRNPNGKKARKAATEAAQGKGGSRRRR